MCLSPILVKNPLYEDSTLVLKRRKHSASEDIILRRIHNSINEYRDSATPFSYRPCGTCPECLHKQQLQLVQRCLAQADHHHILFCTNTYRNESLHYVQSGSRSLPYVDFHDFDTLIRLARKYKVLPDFKYLVCSEYGETFHRPHIHYLIFIPYKHSDTPSTPFEYAARWEEHMKKYWARNLGTRKHPIWSPNSLFVKKWVRGKLNSTYDCKAVVPAQDKLRLSPEQYMNDESNVAFYVTKYVLKFDDYIVRLQRWLRLNLSSEEYKYVWSLVRPRVLMSKFFGANPEHSVKIDSDIQHSLTQSDTAYPQYYLPDGKGSPLSRYYRSGRSISKFYPKTGITITCLPSHFHLTGDLYMKFVDKQNDLIPGSATHYFDPRNESVIQSSSDRFKRQQKTIKSRTVEISPLF